ncbi:histidine kinase/DNA gyrase B/HSP90-like ATPase [Mobilisporobacter senegalensis]|uniref:Histidine kinase/DNA gyrase B/HSP90-like ATPase n=1 Tax=Mobilisporobacter senegalensis TaxID=1329262 RepID=A0A3N1XZ63_9FIRM|nr:histidine kinase [Mobilisporobacter senegalensis]ROR31896.1 histidine kinase/DNA gyrase B/HSP90-like ATPase [Mobilisporobacter senegalensis]
MKILNKSGRGFKYRTKLISFFILAISISTLTGLYSYISSQVLMKSTVKVLTESQELTVVYKEIEAIQNNLEVFLSTNSSDSLLTFYDHSNSISANISDLEESAVYTSRGVKIKNVINMIQHYLITLDDTVTAKRNRNREAYTNGYQEAVKEYNYIGTYIKEMMSTDLSESAEEYIQIQQKYSQVSKFNNGLLAIVVIIILVIIIIFSIEITKPLSKLAAYAKEISDGNFDIEVNVKKTSGEINVLYQAFHVMAINIRKHVYELQEKQRLESTLNEEKVNNLRMKSALREAELLALQSQVNPHFIYNTINIGAKIAMLSGDNATCEYLENAADIFRYNLKGLETQTNLQAEIDNVVSYIYLLRMRFGDVIQFQLDENLEEEYRNYTLPRMTLQPLIENAYIHGIGELEEGGIIGLSTRKEGDSIIITIWDTGKGMSNEQIVKILRNKSSDRTDKKDKGHTTGIGVDNVLKRLRLYYGKYNIMDIRCTGGRTEFILKLPLTYKVKLSSDVI